MRIKPALGVFAGCVVVLFLAKPGPLVEVGAEGTAAVATGPGVLVFDLEDGATQEEIDAFAARYKLKLEYSAAQSKDEALLRANVLDLAVAIERIGGDPLVELIEPEVQMKMDADGMVGSFPNDPLYTRQWNLRQVGALAGWQAGGGRGITVAVLDTGVSPVQDLEGIRLEKGLSFVPGIKTSLDDQGHGTHVAGTIAQRTHNGEGVAGVAPQVTIIPFKVLAAHGGGSSDRIAAAIDEAADQGVDIINMSLGGPHSAILAKAAKDAADRGVLVVASAGNSGQRGLGCPASVREVIAVGSVGPTDTKAPYSTYGEGLEIAAPGGDTSKPGGGILQSTIDGQGGSDYLEFQGTSMAAPHVSGGLAVLLGMGLAPKAAVHTLYATAKDLGAPGYDETYGHGRMDLRAAVSSVTWSRGGLRFMLGGAFAFGLLLLTGLGGRTVLVVPIAAFTAGGAFFLTALPLSPGGLTHWLSLDMARWPLLLGAGWVHNAVWASAAPALGVMFVFGLIRATSVPAAGICIGLGTALLAGGVNQSLAAFDGAGFNQVWLVANGLVAIGGGAAVLAARKMGYSA